MRIAATVSLRASVHFGVGLGAIASVPLLLASVGLLRAIGRLSVLLVRLLQFACEQRAIKPLFKNVVKLCFFKIARRWFYRELRP